MSILDPAEGNQSTKEQRYRCPGAPGPSCKWWWLEASNASLPDTRVNRQDSHPHYQDAKSIYKAGLGSHRGSTCPLRNIFSLPRMLSPPTNGRSENKAPRAAAHPAKPPGLRISLTGQSGQPGGSRLCKQLLTEFLSDRGQWTHAAAGPSGTCHTRTGPCWGPVPDMPPRLTDAPTAGSEVPSISTASGQGREEEPQLRKATC